MEDWQARGSAADALEELLLEVYRDEQNWQLDDLLDLQGRISDEQDRKRESTSPH